MAIEFMVRYERAPDLDLWKDRVESCLRHELALTSVPALSRGPGLGGEHAHELNVFLDGDEETRTWLFMGPFVPPVDEEGFAGECATLSSMHTCKSFLLTLVAAVSFAELVGGTVLDDEGWLESGTEVSPEAALRHVWSQCRGHSFTEAAEAVSDALGASLRGARASTDS
jgi:hypothetical protein